RARAAASREQRMSACAPRNACLPDGPGRRPRPLSRVRLGPRCARRVSQRHRLQTRQPQLRRPDYVRKL
ncbi:hypothetical protein H4S06_006802, partial [Coemansia sp. BCRC 34490]